MKEVPILCVIAWTYLKITVVNKEVNIKGCTLNKFHVYIILNETNP